MNPFVLTNLVSNRLVAEIDWVEGCKPTAIAVQGLKAAIAKYAPNDKRVEVLLDNEIPRARWVALRSNPEGNEVMTSEFLGHDPDDWENAEVVHVLYVPSARPWFGESLYGLTNRLTFERGGKLSTVTQILVFRDTVKKSGILWLTAKKIDRATLVHEFGHVFGLVSNPKHRARAVPLHCTEPQCLMTHPQTRTILYNFFPVLLAGHNPRDYCWKCRADIEGAKRLWEAKAAGDPAIAEVFRRRRKVDNIEAEAEWLGRHDRPDEALARWREILTLTEDDQRKLEANYQIISILTRTGRSEEALQTHDLAFPPGSGPSEMFERADLLCDLGRYIEAFAALDREQLRIRNQSWLYWIATRALTGLGRHAEAARAWDQYFERNPKLRGFERTTAEVIRAECYLRAGQSARAEMLLEQAAKASKRDHDTASALRLQAGWIALESGRTDDGRLLLRNVLDAARSRLRKKGSSPLALQESIAYASALLGDEPGARAALAEVDARIEKGRRAWEDWATHTKVRVLSLLGKNGEALDALERGRRYSFAYEDPCFDRALAPLRAEARFRAFYPHCPVG